MKNMTKYSLKLNIDGKFKFSDLHIGKVIMN